MIDTNGLFASFRPVNLTTQALIWLKLKYAKIINRLVRFGFSVLVLMCNENLIVVPF